jgi:hypothetical protein
VERRLDKTAAEEAENQRRFEAEERARLDAEERRREWYEREHEQRMEELYGDDLKRFPQNVKKPHATNKDESNKFKYTVWAKVVHRKQFEDNVEKEFDSSFAPLNEASFRVEYAFYCKNPWGCNKDEVNADEDMELSGGLRYMRSNPDGGGSLTVSVMPSVAFDCLQPHWDMSEARNQPRRERRPETSFSSAIRKPATKHLDEGKRLEYIVWTSFGYDYDGWHSYAGLSEHIFNSSFSSIEEANQRAEYVFYYENPWGLHDEYDFPYPEMDTVTPDGFRLLKTFAGDSERWTVSAIPSVAFDYMDL